jgi:peptidoglycan/LPS O-acetylase OafA/YrhL
MNRSTSTYLDLARFCAALLVVAGHTEWSFAPGFAPWVRTGHLNTLAVGVFFVLSGFVIAYVVDKKEADAGDYFLSRAARVYSVVVPALILTLIADSLGKWLAPEGYATGLRMLNVGKDAARDLVSLTFVNGFWRWHLQPGTNVAFWSLTYEVPYYVAFGLFYFGGVAGRIASILLMVLAGPYISIVFGLWLMGMGCYHLCRTMTLRQRLGRSLFAVSLVGLCAAPFLAARFFPENLFGSGLAPLSQLYLPGIPFAGSIVGFRFSDLSLERYAHAIRWAAGATFTVYLVHFPLGIFLHALVPNGWPLAVRWLGIFSTLIVVCFVVAQFTERRKDLWRGAIEKLVTKVMGHVGMLQR